MGNRERKAVRHLLVSLVALAAAAAPAVGSHGGQYQQNPVEHDDQGRSDEPDFARTAVLGPPLENRVLDLDLDGLAAPDAALPPPLPMHLPVLAPGCTDDAGRVPSGTCGLWTAGAFGVVPPRLLGVCGFGGECGTVPPGGWQATKATVVRFLDVRADAMPWGPVGATVRLDVNHKLRDSGVAEAAGLPPAIAGPVALWAWYGDWRDLNANGVIDHLADEAGHVDPGNEFRWRGRCQDGLITPPYCWPDHPAPRLLGFAFPGDHHARCGLAPAREEFVACPVPADLPGREAACALDERAVHLAGVAVLGRCGADGGGDPLLGPQGSVEPDAAFRDETSHAQASARGWHFDRGHAAWHYDQSLAVGQVFVAALVGPDGPARPGEARFLDVDVHRALSPDLEALVQGQAKPALRGAWLLARGALP